MPGGHAASACPYTTNAAFVASQQPSAPVPAAARPPETSPQTRTTSQHRTITQPRLRRSPGRRGERAPGPWATPDVTLFRAASSVKLGSGPRRRPGATPPNGAGPPLEQPLSMKLLVVVEIIAGSRDNATSLSFPRFAESQTTQHSPPILTVAVVSSTRASPHIKLLRQGQLTSHLETGRQSRYAQRPLCAFQASA